VESVLQSLNATLADVKIQRFEIYKTVKASFDEFTSYINHEASVQHQQLAGEARQITDLRASRVGKRMKHVNNLKSKSKSAANSVTTGTKKPYSWWLYVLIPILIAIFIYVSYNYTTYNVNYEDFLANYDVLGLTPSATLKEVKKAYRDLSLKWHPDKNPRDCADCAKNYMTITDAYKQIQDYESGRLIITKPDEH